MIFRVNSELIVSGKHNQYQYGSIEKKTHEIVNWEMISINDESNINLHLFRIVAFLFTR